MTRTTRRQREPATCEGLVKWITDNLGVRALAPLTGTDNKALAAAVHILELWGMGDDRLLQALRIVVLEMQPSTRYFAYHAVAYLAEWETRDRVWRSAGLSFDDLVRAPRCRGDRDAWTCEELESMDRR